MIELPAVHDPTQAAKIIGQTAAARALRPDAVAARPVDRRVAERRSPNTSLFDLLILVQTGTKGAPSAYYLFNSRTHRLIAGPDQTLTAAASTTRS